MQAVLWPCDSPAYMLTAVGFKPRALEFWGAPRWQGRAVLHLSIYELGCHLRFYEKLIWGKYKSINKTQGWVYNFTESSLNCWDKEGPCSVQCPHWAQMDALCWALPPLPPPVGAWGKMEMFCSCCASTPSTEVSPVRPAHCRGMRLGQWEADLLHGLDPRPPMPDHFFVIVVAFIFI